MLVKIKGIVISETNYSESSKIINVLCEEYGKIGLMAKGARSLKSPLRAVSQKLVYGEFTIKYKEKGLSTLIEVNVINSFRNIMTDFKCASYAFYLLDLFNQIFKDSQKIDNNVYLLLENALLKIDNGLNPLLITNIVELQLLKYLGVALELNKCVNCGNNEVISINLDYGGTVCVNCINENDALFNPKTVKLIRLMYLVNLNKLDNINIDNKNIIKEINQFINDYYSKYTGLYLKNKENIEKLLFNLR